jgi:hypothetical protein
LLTTPEKKIQQKIEKDWKQGWIGGRGGGFSDGKGAGFSDGRKHLQYWNGVKHVLWYLKGSEDVGHVSDF